jgi:hypothetical protein
LMGERLMRLTDQMDGTEWQRARNAQLRHRERGNFDLTVLNDDLAPTRWQEVRNDQAAGKLSAATAPSVVKPEFDVDRRFLADREGSRHDMYVPTDRYQKVVGDSGPTIGIGVDFGSKDSAYLTSLGLRPELVDRLTPYLGKKRDHALGFVKANPLSLDEAELDALNGAVQDRELKKLAARYNEASRVGPFSSLPKATQTAIASLYFQYGTDAPDKAAPNYWHQITTGEWEGAYRNLRAFGDVYRTRRGLEADKLKEDIDAGRLPATRPHADGKH